MEVQQLYTTLLRKRKQQYWQAVRKLFGSSIVAYYRMVETSGIVMLDAVNELDGEYNGPTLAAVTSPISGEIAPSFDGAGDDCNIYAAANAVNIAAAGGLLGWAKVSGAGDWTDGAQRSIISIYSLTGDNIVLGKAVVSNQLNVKFVYGGVDLSYSIPYSSLAWFSWCYTWDKTADKFNFYLNGENGGMEQSGLGVWAGALYTDYCRLGGFGGGTAPFKGALSNVLFVNRLVTETEALQFVTLAANP